MMLCEACEKENRSIARFCKWCGTELKETADPLQLLVGMEQVKENMQELIATCHSLSQRSKKSGLSYRLSMNTLIIGDTGTGKTLLAHTLQELLRSSGVVSQPQLRLVDAVDWSDFCEHWDDNIKKSRGGVLCIENVQKLLPAGYSDTIYELDKLFNEMTKWNNDPVVILTGLPGGFEGFLAANPVIRNRFRYLFRLNGFSAVELFQICEERLKSKFGLQLNEASAKRLLGYFKYALKHRDDSFGHAHLATEKAEKIFTCQLKRAIGNSEDNVVLPEDIKGNIYEEKTATQIMSELDRFVGLDNVKDEVRSLLSFLKVEKLRNDGRLPELKLHYVFTGNPGTGKTTIARVMAEVFQAMEVLPTGHLVEADRSSLVGQYQGETALKTNELVDRALGGILFIDEAYNLIQGDNDSFGKEAINTLLKRLEDEKGKFICIVAGYSKEMFDFIDANPGLKSRFNRTLEFKDYTPSQLVQIFKRMVETDRMELHPEAEECLPGFFERMYLTRDRNFGNAREVVKAYELAKNRQGTRIQEKYASMPVSLDALNLITRLDIEGSEALQQRSLSDVLDGMNDFIGMEPVKQAIRELARQAEFNRLRAERGIGFAEIQPIHIVLTGNPGTGKTTIARKLGEVFKAIKVLPSDRVVEADRSKMVGQYQGETPKLVNRLCDQAMGGILFVDEAYTLAPVSSGGEKDTYGTEAIETLMKRMEDDRGKFVVVTAGYRTEMENFLRANPGLESRFTHRLHIDDYTQDELLEIFLALVYKKSYSLTDDALDYLRKAIQQRVDAGKRNFGNAREMRKLFDETLQRMSTRLMTATEELSDSHFSIIQSADIPYEAPKEVEAGASMAELNELIGLGGVKSAVSDMISFLNMERQRAVAMEMKPEGLKDHFVFTGNPGTGKTTVARIMARVFHSLGVIPTDHLVEADRSSLVAGYSGQTAIKTNQLVDSALGGVLFIDEAYTLSDDASSGGFGKEAIDTLLKRLEDDRGKFICIVAGYTGEMERFIRTNPGLQSRFTRYIHFDDYLPADLAAIFRSQVSKRKLKLTPEADQIVEPYFEQLYARRDVHFGNAREVRKQVDQTLMRQGKRLMSMLGQEEFSPEMLLWITPEDIQEPINEQKERV